MRYASSGVRLPEPVCESTISAQNRGGVGSRGSQKRDADFIEHVYTASMHATMMARPVRARRRMSTIAWV